MSDGELSKYKNKRDFRKSPEPRGDDGDRPDFADDDNPFFVVQHHRASNDHFDFRLEIDGVLKSWAIPKGPSTDPADKRLAVHVEDHPLDYGDFEGRIPEDEYGGGVVIVWDAGPYRNIKTDEDGEEMSMAAAMDQGTVEVWLEGKKIRGGYALIHSKMRGDEQNWLLVKMDDDAADARRNPASTEPESVLTGRTLDDMEEADDLPEWEDEND